MRKFFALTLIGLMCPVMAMAQDHPAGQPATPPPQPAGSPTGTPGAAPGGAPLTAQPEMPPAAKPVPVPDGPVVKTEEREGGLLCEDLKIGDGYEIKPGNWVVAFYHGTLKDGGKVFDSAFTRGEPVVFPLTGVVEGWQKGVPGMKVGGVRRLTVPAKMAYADKSPSADIPANADLVFVIQLEGALQVEDIKPGTGEEVTGPCVAVTTHTVKDQAGKEVEKIEGDKLYVWIPGEMNPPGSRFDSLQEGIMGMKVGGQRRIIIPKEMNASPPQANSTRPQRVPLTIELELKAVRNLGAPHR